MATRKEQAFELFSQGKRPGDAEVLALGLAKSSQKKYYRQWKSQQFVEQVTPIEAKPAKKVTLQSIPMMGIFEHEEVTYRKTKYLRGGNVLAHNADYVAGGDMIHGVSERAFEITTLVTPK